jgi:hypothetical protein
LRENGEREVRFLNNLRAVNVWLTKLCPHSSGGCDVCATPN